MAGFTRLGVRHLHRWLLTGFGQALGPMHHLPWDMCLDVMHETSSVTYEVGFMVEIRGDVDQSLGSVRCSSCTDGMDGDVSVNNWTMFVTMRVDEDTKI